MLLPLLLNLWDAIIGPPPVTAVYATCEWSHQLATTCAPSASLANTCTAEHSLASTCHHTVEPT